MKNKFFLLPLIVLLAVLFIWAVPPNTKIGAPLRQLASVAELGMARGTSYYVDCSSGDDTRDGKNENSAWKTLSKVNAYSRTPGFLAGDAIKLKRGCVWREKLQILSSGKDGAYLIIEDYGSLSLAKPKILASENLKKWTNLGNNRWASPTGYGGAAFVLLTAEIENPIWGVNVAKFGQEADLDSNGDLWQDQTNDQIILYTTNPSGPAGAWPQIEVGVRDRGVEIVGLGYVYLKNIDARYGTGGSFRVSNSHHVVLDGVEASWGGGTISGIKNMRAGDIIKIDTNSHDITVINSKSSYAWEACLSVEAWRAGDKIYNITIENNIFNRCGLGIGLNTPYYGPDSYLYNVTVKNNSITKSGLGWSPPEMASHGTGIWLYQAEENAGHQHDILIENNTIDTFTGDGLYIMDGGPYYVRKNIIKNGSGLYRGSTQYPAGIAIHGGAASGDSPSDVSGEFSQNIVFNNVRGLYLVNNQPTNNLNFYHNIFANNAKDNYANLHVDYNTTKLNLINNILYSDSGILVSVPKADSFLADNNLFYWGSGTLVKAANYSKNDPAWYKTNLKTDANSIFGKIPLFVSLGSNWQVASGSPVIDKGADLGLLGDFAGNKFVGRPDIGAYEYLAPAPACLEKWSCGEWGTCFSGQQTRTCFDSNGCQTSIVRPPEKQSCAVSTNQVQDLATTNPVTSPTVSVNPTTTITSTTSVPVADPVVLPSPGDLNREPVLISYKIDRVGVFKVSFSAQVIDPDGNNLTYLWSFGDGETSSSLEVVHKYSRPGPKNVTLTVSDGKARKVFGPKAILVW